MSSIKSASCCGKTTAASENVYEDCIFEYKNKSNKNFIIYNREEKKNGAYVINTYLLSNSSRALAPTKITKETALELLLDKTNIMVKKVDDTNTKNKVFNKIRSVRATNLMISKLQGSKYDNKQSTTDELGLLSRWKQMARKR